MHGTVGGLFSIHVVFIMEFVECIALLKVCFLFAAFFSRITCGFSVLAEAQ